MFEAKRTLIPLHHRTSQNAGGANDTQIFNFFNLLLNKLKLVETKTHIDYLISVFFDPIFFAANCFRSNDEDINKTKPTFTTTLYYRAYSVQSKQRKSIPCDNESQFLVIAAITNLSIVMQSF